MEIVKTSPKAKPTLLLILCILSFIGSGLNIISNFIGMLISPIEDFLGQGIFEMVVQEVNNDSLNKFIEQAFVYAQNAMLYMFEISLANFILYSASLAGAILMLQLKKIGFYIYSVAQISLLFVSPIFVGFNFFSNIGILFASIFTILFIGLYAINLKKMN